MLTREPVHPIVEVTDSKPQTIWASWFMAWQTRLHDLRHSVKGMWRKPLSVQLPQNDRKMAVAHAALLATLLYVCALALLIHFILGHAADGMDNGLRSSLTIEILNPAADQKDWKSTDERLKMVQVELRKLPGIVKAEAVPLTHMRDLLKPWLGEKTSLDNLPLPLLLDVQLDPRATIDKNAILHITNAVPGAVLDDHGQFMGQLVAFGGMLRDISLYVLLLGVAALVLSAYFSAQANFYMNRSMIGILHLIGAEDNAIAQHMGMNILRLMLVSASIALTFLFATLILIVRASAGIDFSFFPNFDIGLLQWLGLIVQWVLLFALAILLCLLAARFTVLQALRKLL